ncbi:hypothetical protein JDFR1000234_62 [uncultured archaeal virus]|jgi:hypothetical protein|uniref:Uncharacterized protein n=1 Tax=uncultured archaeal virus TaxID=1960247 RepID=A0A1S5Y338_9VIRU|nr:hypothetical protein JDFR1000234_62 [uncultured archaeal virus]
MSYTEREALNKMVRHEEGTQTGNTADTYSNILDWDTRVLSSKTLILANTGANSLDYQVITRAAYNGTDFVETSGSLAAGDTIKIVLNSYYARVIVKVKSTTAGSATSYQLDYCARGVM